jgi:hypothetical protein
MAYVRKIDKDGTANGTLDEGEIGLDRGTGKLYVGDGTAAGKDDSLVVNAKKADQLADTKNIALTGDVTGTVDTDLSESTSIDTTVIAASTTVAGKVQLVDTLTDTSTDKALTAAQGKVLNDARALLGKSNFISSGVINKQDDANLFNESERNMAKYPDNETGDAAWAAYTDTIKGKMANTDRFVNFDGKVVDTYGPELISESTLLGTARLFSDTYTDGASTFTMVDDNTQSVEGYIGITLNNLVEGTDYLLSFTKDKVTVSSNTEDKLLIDSIFTNMTKGGGNVQLLFTAGVDNVVYFYAKNGDGEVTTVSEISVREITTVDMTDNMPEVTIETTTTATNTYNNGDYAVVGNDIYRAIQDGVTGDLTNTLNFEDRTQFGITNKILATMRDDGTIKTEVCFVDTAIEDCGNAHVVMTDNGYTKLSNGLYSKDGNIVTPLGTWSTLNKGAFHPVYNYFGTHNWLVQGVEHYDWYQNSGYSKDSTSDCFNPNISSIEQLRASVSNSLPISGRPDDKYYDIIYPDQWIDLRIEANAISEKDELNRVGTKAKSGQLDGIGGVVAIVQSTYQLYYYSSTQIAMYNSGGLEGITTEQQQSLINSGGFHFNYLGTDYTATFTLEYIGYTVYSVSPELPSDIDTVRYYDMVIYNLPITIPHPSSGTALITEVLADPDRYSDDMKAILASGNSLMFTPNLVDDTGASNIPNSTDGTDGKATFKLNNKFTTTHQVLKSADKGVNWSPLTLTTHYTVDTVTNSITFTAGNIPLATDMIMISNAAKIPTTQVSDPKAVKLVGNYVTGTNSHSIYKGNQLVPTGNINFGNGDNGLESRVVENIELNGADYSTDSGTIQLLQYDIIYITNNSSSGSVGNFYKMIRGDFGTGVPLADYTGFDNDADFEDLGKSFISALPTHSTITLDDSNSPAVKFIETIAEDDDGMAHYQVFAQEMVSQGGVYGGDDNQFTQLTNGTLTDDSPVPTEIKTIVASRPLNKYIGDK